MDGTGWQLADTSCPVGPRASWLDPEVLSFIPHQVGHQLRDCIASLLITALKHASASIVIVTAPFYPLPSAVMPVPSRLSNLFP